jgi:hypothetical protein
LGKRELKKSNLTLLEWKLAQLDATPEVESKEEE